jgi:hypothetical protein
VIPLEQSLADALQHARVALARGRALRHEPDRPFRHTDQQEESQ